MNTYIYLLAVLTSCHKINSFKNDLKFKLEVPGKLGNNFSDFWLRMYPDSGFRQITHFRGNKPSRIDIFIKNSDFSQYYYSFPSKYIDSSYTFMKNDTGYILPGNKKYIQSYGNTIWAQDDGGNIYQYEYYFDGDSLNANKYLNGKITEASKFILNSKNKTLLYLEYSNDKLVQYHKYYYDKDTVLSFIEKYTASNEKTGIKKFEYKPRLIIASSYTDSRLSSLDSVLLDRNNHLQRIVSYNLDSENNLTLIHQYRYSYNRIDPATLEFIKKDNFQLYMRLKKYW